jgi:hypothetical protein
MHSYERRATEVEERYENQINLEKEKKRQELVVVWSSGSMLQRCADQEMW